MEERPEQLRLRQLQAEYDLWNNKLHHLRKSRIIQTDASILFKLDYEIQEAQQERDCVGQEIEALQVRQTRNGTSRSVSPSREAPAGIPASTAQGGSSSSVRQPAFDQASDTTQGEYHSCFISYAHQDEKLAQQLHRDLEKRGVHCWFAPHNMKIGARIRPTIDQAIHKHDRLLLLLSTHSIESAWVEDEVEAALERENREGRTMLFPIRLDDAVVTTNQAWAAKIRRTRHIGDFTNWTDPTSYNQALERLLRDLQIDE